MSVILTNLRALTQFDGRTGRDAFWPYVGVVAVVVFLIVGAGMATIINQIIEGTPGDEPSFEVIAFSLPAAFVVATILLAAAVSRRLHDSDLAAYFGLAPLPFIAFSSVMMPRVFASFWLDTDPALGPFFAVFASNILYVLSLLILALLLLRRGTSGPNRYGSAPEHR